MNVEEREPEGMFQVRAEEDGLARPEVVKGCRKTKCGSAVAKLMATAR